MHHGTCTDRRVPSGPLSHRENLSHEAAEPSLLPLDRLHRFRQLRAANQPAAQPTMDLSAFTHLSISSSQRLWYICTMVRKSNKHGQFRGELLNRQENMTFTGGSAGLEDDIFVAQFESCQFPGDQFRHADHLRLAWIYLRNYGCDVAEQRMRQSIQSFARRLGATHKYHETITIFWMRLLDVAIRLSSRSENFEDFIEAHAWLLEKDVVLEFYSRELLTSDTARRAWVEPDLKPIPIADRRSLRPAPPYGFAS
jgi:hypothetical protein